MTHYTNLRRATAYNIAACAFMVLALSAIVASLLYAMAHGNLGGSLLFFVAIGLAAVGELFHHRARTLVLRPIEVHTDDAE